MEITQKELDERVALLHRLKTLLEQQRNKFREYLNILEKQQDSISKEDPESLIAHTELEQQIVRNIANLQKVIVPMSKMYKNSDNGKNPATEIQNLQKDLNDLQNKVLKQNQINRDLLRVHIDSIKSQIQNFRNPYKNANSVYAQTQPVAQLVQVEA
jgi:flagellar biosynthesis/type III secretory pathway chaperone